MKRILMAIVALLTASLAISACSSTPAEPTVEVSAEAFVIDVRSPEEFAAGHLEGANLLDLNSGEFAQVMPTLDPEAEYFVYCRSGNRSGQATQMMQAAGFTNVTDLGSVENASKATGIPVVK